MIILVVGGSSSLGKKICLALLRLGHTVFASYNTTNVPRETNLFPIKIDVTNTKSCEQAIKNIVKKTNRIDTVIYVTGISPKGQWDTFSSDDFSSVLDINTVGAFRVAKASTPWLKKAKGNLIFISSLSGLASFPNFSIYSSSKFALRALSTSLYHELFKKVHVTCVFPGAIDYHRTVSVQNSARGRIPIIRLLLPLVSVDEVVQRIINLLSSKRHPPELLIGRDVTIVNLLVRFLPTVAWYHLQQLVWSKQK